MFWYGLHIHVFAIERKHWMLNDKAIVFSLTFLVLWYGIHIFVLAIARKH